jgi:hypothetical protein
VKGRAIVVYNYEEKVVPDVSSTCATSLDPRPSAGKGRKDGLTVHVH